MIRLVLVGFLHSDTCFCFYLHAVIRTVLWETWRCFLQILLSISVPACGSVQLRAGWCADPMMTGADSASDSTLKRQETDRIRQTMKRERRQPGVTQSRNHPEKWLNYWRNEFDKTKKNTCVLIKKNFFIDTNEARIMYFRQTLKSLISLMHYSLACGSDPSLTIFSLYTRLAVAHSACSAELFNPSQLLAEHRLRSKTHPATFVPLLALKPQHWDGLHSSLSSLCSFSNLPLQLASSFLCVLVFILCSLAAQLRWRQYINIHVEEAENLE